MSKKRAVVIRPDVAANSVESYLKHTGFEMDKRIKITEGDIRDMPSSGIDLVVIYPVWSVEYSTMAMRLVEALRPDHGSPSPVELLVLTSHSPHDRDAVGEVLSKMKRRGAQVINPRVDVLYRGAIDKIYAK